MRIYKHKGLQSWWPDWSTLGYVGCLSQRLVPIALHSYLHGMNPGFDASYSFYCGDSSSIQRADGHQACGDREVSLYEKHKENQKE